MLGIENKRSEGWKENIVYGKGKERRLKNMVEMNDNHFGFMSGSCTMEPIHS